MKLLVTGGAGFIGSNFIHYWLKKYPKDKVVNLDSLTYAGNLASLKNIAGLPNYQFIKGNICSRKSVEEAMGEVEAVIHFAAESHVDRSITGPEIFVKTNVLGTQVLLEFALKYKVKRFHYVSTDEVFGALKDGGKDKFDENWPYRPNSPYSASKVGGECLVRAYYKTFGLPISVSNCSNNYGPYQYPEKLIPLAITNLLEGRKIPIYGDGQQVRDWLFVEDHCRAIDLIIQDNKTIGGTFCIGGVSKDITNLELIKKILFLMGYKEDKIEYVTDRPGHDRRYSVNWSKINKKLGWRPEADLSTYLHQTINWYKNNRAWWLPLIRK